MCARQATKSPRERQHLISFVESEIIGRMKRFADPGDFSNGPLGFGYLNHARHSRRQMPLDMAVEEP